MEDKQIQCADCQRTFTFSASEQDFYQQRNMSDPKRCKECREVRKANREGGGGGGGFRRGGGDEGRGNRA